MTEPYEVIPGQLNNHKIDRAMTVLFGVFVLAMIFAAGAVAQHAFFEPPPWNPLGPFPVQRVVNPRRVPLDGLVVVEGKKCARETVEVTSVVKWVYPSGAVPTGGGQGVLTKGCTTYTVKDGTAFHNGVKPEVQAEQRRLCAAGIPNTPWRITGAMTPHKDGRSGDVAIWITAPFTLGCT